MLWVDKHRPATVDKLDFHKDQALRLKQMVSKSSDFPHLLFYGPSGAGKKTRVIALLREIYGNGIEKVKSEHRNFKFELPSGSKKEVEINIVSSNYHIELTPADVGNNDRLIVQEVIKEMAGSQAIQTTENQKCFKVVILNEVDRLSREAQQALRRTMEKYMSTCRLMLLCNSPCRVIDPLRSRCLAIRVPAPTNEQIVEVLNMVAKKEGIQLPQGLATRIATESAGNLRRAILAMEACRVQSYPLTDNQPIAQMDWEMYIKEIAADIMKEQSPKKLLEVRQKLYEVLVNCIPPETVMRKLATSLMSSVDTEMKQELTKWASHYEHQMQQGSKPIFHLEAFIAKFMSLYKQYLITWM